METKSATIAGREIKCFMHWFGRTSRFALPSDLARCAKSMGSVPAPPRFRNALARLEEKGYVQQPHTSAGRVPTERGYRFYVTKCMTDEALGLDDNATELRRQLEVQLREGDMQEIMGQLAQIIGNVSQQLGLVLAPRFEQGILGQLELVHLAESRLLLVVTINQGLVKVS